METLLDADYTTLDEKAVIRLFYKTDKGRKTVEVDDFRPYFFALAEDEETKSLQEEVEKLPGVIKTSIERLSWKQRETDVLKIVLDHPKNVPDLREQVKSIESCKSVKEAYTPFADRYLTDSGIVPMEGCEEIGLNVASFDMEVYNPKGEPRPEKDPIIMISYADSKGLRKVWTYKSLPGCDMDYVETLGGEKEVIDAFIETVKDREIDIIVTYNGDNFDFPYLKQRSDLHNVKVALGIDGSSVKLERRGMNMGSKIRGRPHVDMYPICRQIFNLSRYTLEDVYAEISGTEKRDIDINNMVSVWDDPDEKNAKELVEYSMSDADATLEIALELLPLHYEICRITRELIYKSTRAGSGQRVESLLMKKAFEKKILVPNRPSERVAALRKGDTYSGGYVVDPVRGIHDNILLFDFRSLYPSIIISHNIDPATLNCNCCSETLVTGHHFCTKTPGFIPQTLKEIVDRRIAVKKQLGAETDPKKKRFLGVEQQALKLLANSMYGYFGFPRARWYSRECAETITSLGRKYIQDTIEMVSGFGFEVIYGDTDSVYLVDKTKKSPEEILENAKSFLGEINSKLPEAMELEFEGFYPRGIFITKKRYALMDEKNQLIIKGLETRRRDWADIAKETQKAVLNSLLKEKNPQKAAEHVKKTIARIKNGDVPLEELTINTQITRDMADYKTEGPHIHAAKKAMKKGLEFRQGSIVTYIITKKGSSISDKAKIIDFVENGDYDPDYYINNQVLPAVLRILEALGYSEDELKGHGRQTTLFGF